MSVLNYIVTKLKTGVITFINMVILSNRDLPMHDYKEVVDTEEPMTYVVGTDNITSGSDQRKLFVSKSTPIWSDVECTISFNNTNNVVHTILANTDYWFDQNIRAVNVITIGADGTLYMLFAGTLPKEARIGA